MRSLLWTGVFVFLMLELALTLILVIPVPKKIRNWICLEVSKFELKEKLKMPLMAIFFALMLALMDSINYLSQIYNQEDREDERGVGNVIDRHLLKEKEYKAARNMYLVGFALTLLFVIGRITDLMKEHADLEGELENMRLAAKMKAKHEAEEKPVESKKKD